MTIYSRIHGFTVSDFMVHDRVRSLSLKDKTGGDVSIFGSIEEWTELRDSLNAMLDTVMLQETGENVPSGRGDAIRRFYAAKVEAEVEAEHEKEKSDG